MSWPARARPERTTSCPASIAFLELRQHRVSRSPALPRTAAGLRRWAFAALARISSLTGSGFPADLAQFAERGGLRHGGQPSPRHSRRQAPDSASATATVATRPGAPGAALAQRAHMRSPRTGGQGERRVVARRGVRWPKAVPLTGEWLVRAAGHGEWRTVADRSLDDSGWTVSRSPGRWWLDDGLGDRRCRSVPTPLRPSHPGRIRHGFRCPRLVGHQRPLRARSYLAGRRLSRWTSAAGTTSEPSRSRGRLGPGDAHVGPHIWSPSKQPTPRTDRNRHLTPRSPTSGLNERAPHASSVHASWSSRLTTTGRCCASPQQSTAPPPTDPKSPRRCCRAQHRPPTSPTIGNGLARSSPVLARGRNNLEWLVALEQPALWWPSGMGAQPRYEVSVALSVGRADESHGAVHNRHPHGERASAPSCW